jgi:hypothetical protein
VRFALGVPFLLALSIAGPTALAFACRVRRDVGARGALRRARGYAFVVILAVLFFACLGRMNNATEFLYFQF